MHGNPSRLAICLSLAALCLSAPLAAQTLYKWTDAHGKTQYSDRPPKDFKGEVTRIEPDVQPDPPALRPRPAAPKAEAATPAPAAADIAGQRRALRERLGAALAAARDKRDAAKRALDSAGSPEVDERQIVQQRFARGTKPGTARSNCREVVGGDGKKALMCPALVPGEGYYDRIRQLEEALARAEDELAAAEQAYRRSVD